MSVENRLRQGLARNAGSVLPETELALVAVRRRVRRRSRVRGAGVLAGVAASAAIVTLVGPGLVQSIRPDDGPAVRPDLAATTQILTGRYTTTLAGTMPSLTDPTLQGRWTIQLDDDGTMIVEAPQSYQGVVSATLFEATPGRLRTNAFEQDLCSGSGVGSYGWTRSGTTVTFTALDDSCAGRVAVFASQPWQLTP